MRQPTPPSFPTLRTATARHLRQRDQHPDDAYADMVEALASYLEEGWAEWEADEVWRRRLDDLPGDQSGQLLRETARSLIERLESVLADADRPTVEVRVGLEEARDEAINRVHALRVAGYRREVVRAGAEVLGQLLEQAYLVRDLRAVAEEQDVAPEELAPAVLTVVEAEAAGLRSLLNWSPPEGRTPGRLPEPVADELERLAEERVDVEQSLTRVGEEAVGSTLADASTGEGSVARPSVRRLWHYGEEEREAITELVRSLQADHRPAEVMDRLRLDRGAPVSRETLEAWVRQLQTGVRRTWRHVRSNLEEEAALALDVYEAPASEREERVPGEASEDDRRIDLRPLVAFAMEFRGSDFVSREERRRLRLEGATSVFRDQVATRQTLAGPVSDPTEREIVRREALTHLERAGTRLQEAAAAYEDADQRWREAVEFQMRVRKRERLPLSRKHDVDVTPRQARELFYQDAIRNGGLPLGWVLADLYDSELEFGPEEQADFVALAIESAWRYAVDYASEDRTLRRAEIQLRREADELSTGEALEARARELVDEALAKQDGQRDKGLSRTALAGRMVDRVRAAEEVRLLTHLWLQEPAALRRFVVERSRELPHTRRFAQRSGTTWKKRRARNGQMYGELDEDTAVAWKRERDRAFAGHDVEPASDPGHRRRR